jgi:hypothetical protein
LPRLVDIVPPAWFQATYGPLSLRVQDDDSAIDLSTLRWTFMPEEVPGAREYWIGTKRYGDVLLHIHRDEPEPGATWEELDRLLTELFGR